MGIGRFCWRNRENPRRFSKTSLENPRESRNRLSVSFNVHESPRRVVRKTSKASEIRDYLMCLCCGPVAEYMAES
jgi:hypothetical protein